MNILLSRALVCDPQSPFNGKQCDLLISNGFITSIVVSGKKSIKTPAGSKTIDCKGASLSPGFVDMRAHLGEPGYEYKETLASAAKAASAGGYTTITCLPATLPVLQSKNDMEFILSKAASLPVHILPYGALSKNRDGKELNELFDMHQSGAVGFTDANRPVQHAGLLQIALEYSSVFNGLILTHPHDITLTAQNGVHEGVAATYTGMKGMPAIAEELMVSRDIELARYSKTRIHISHISSKVSVEIIRKAKKTGVNVTCDVAVANLVWTDESLSDYDTRYKLSPPLRSKNDRKALWDGLIDGTIDCIVSDHYPQDIEHKHVEFEYAEPGMIQLQTAFSLLCMFAPKNYDHQLLIQHLSIHPRKILGLEPISITENSTAELTLWDSETNWDYSTSTNFSISANSPVMFTTLKGKVRATINKDRIHQF